MTKKSDAPAIRFKGFSDAWEQRKFSDVVATRRGLTYKPSDIRKNGVRVLRSSNIAEDSFVLSDEDVFVVREAVNIDCVRANDILITAANGSSRLVGKHTIISGIPEESAVHGGFMLLGTTKEPHFVNASMGSSWYRRFIELFVAGGNGAIGNLNKNDLDNQDIAIPSEKEQKKIGSFFRQLDNLITLHQRKFEKLTNVKKSMLEKMFPQNGSSYPEIRFKGFTDPWEQRKLGDIADIVGGGTPSTGNQSYWDGDIDWYAPAEIADQIYANSSQKKITGLGYENSSAKMLPPGTVLFTSRAGIGKTAILTRKGCTNQGFQSIVPHRGELDSYFIFSRTEELKRYGELVGAGSTFVEVSGKQMAVMELMMPPTMREQQTIGGFFQQLDHLITLHQRELEKLQNIKKSMLEKMFV
jgi:putative type I S-subunit protein